MKNAIVLVCADDMRKSRAAASHIQSWIERRWLDCQVSSAYLMTKDDTEKEKVCGEIWEAARNREIQYLLLDTPETLANLLDTSISVAQTTAYQLSREGVHVIFTDAPFFSCKPPYTVTYYNGTFEKVSLWDYLAIVRRECSEMEYRCKEWANPDLFHPHRI